MNSKLKTIFAVIGVLGLLAGADTVRTQAQILTLLGDNTTGDISPQDFRDMVVSQSVYGAMYVTDGSTAQGSLSTTPVKVTGFATNGASSGTTPDATTDDDITLGANSGGDYEVHFHAGFSGTANETFTFHLRDDAVEVPGCSATRKISSGGDVGSTGFSCLATIAGSSVITVYVESAAGSGDEITPEHMGLTLSRVE